jgi:hypothetical protein
MALLVSSTAEAQHAALPATLVALDSAEGQRLLLESDAHADFFALSEQLVTQDDPGYCGIASAVTVLNALQVPAPVAPAWGAHVFTQDDFFNDKAKTILQPGFKGGVTLQQLADMIQCHPATASVLYASDTTLDAFRSVAAENLASAGDFLIVNYNRADVGQEYMGHISPLGAYDAKADKILVMDVARYKYPPVWVDTPALFAAMSTSDFVSGKSRGFLSVAAAPSAPGPSGAKAPRSPLRILAGILAVAFLLGGALGAFVQTFRLKRRYKRLGRV